VENQGGVGVLGKKEIIALMSNEVLIKNGNIARVRGASYDMTVGPIFVDGKIRKSATELISEKVEPGGVINIFTSEVLDLPNDVCATAFAINSMSSRGFLVLNPGHIDPGFKGALTVKALNIRKVPYVIQSGEPIFTVVFERLPAVTEGYGGNRSSDERERLFNKEIVETSCDSLSTLILQDPNGPYPSREEVRAAIQRHWMSWLSIAFAGVAAVTSLILLARELMGPATAATTPAQIVMPLPNQLSNNGMPATLPDAGNSTLSNAQSSGVGLSNQERRGEKPTPSEPDPTTPQGRNTGKSGGANEHQ
jgi:deoxycytidine triphosphate deaminase